MAATDQPAQPHAKQPVHHQGDLKRNTRHCVQRGHQPGLLHTMEVQDGLRDDALVQAVGVEET